MFKNKVAIISGSSQGIGKTLAKEFIKIGTKVVINGRNAERLAETEKELISMEGTVLSVVADVTDENQAKSLIQRSIEQFGQIDFLINNAGISMRGNFSELNPKVFNIVFNTNVFGVANLSIAALPYIRESKGSLVFVSSVAGVRGLPGLSAYCSSKMALRAIAESIRIEEHKSGIHIGLIQVGYTENDLNKQTVGPKGELILINDRSKFKAQTKESVAKAIIKNIRKRKFIVTLSLLGKLNSYVQSIMPGLVEFALIRSLAKIKKMS